MAQGGVGGAKHPSTLQELSQFAAKQKVKHMLNKILNALTITIVLISVFIFGI